MAGFGYSIDTATAGHVNLAADFTGLQLGLPSGARGTPVKLRP